MRRWSWRSLTAILICTVGLAIASMTNSYFQYVSQSVYEDSTRHLVEIYSQVSNTFRAFLEKNWGNLNDWSRHIQTLEADEETRKYLLDCREYWQFSEFYFLSADGNYLTPEGKRGNMKLDGALDRLFRLKQPVMAGEVLDGGNDITVFAAAAPAGTYQDFAYDAIAVSYTNADMLKSLKVNAFSGKSVCFVVHADGRVLLSTQSGGSAFENMLTYLQNDSDLSRTELNELCQNWENGVSGVLLCQFNGSGGHYISYQPTGYQDCVLLGVVPEDAAGISLLAIQRATVEILLKVLLLLGIPAVLAAVWRVRKQTRKSALELRYRELMFDTLSISVDDIFIMLDQKSWQVDYISPNVERLLGIPLEAALENVRLLGESAVDVSGINFREELAAILVGDSRQWEREHVHQTTGERRWYRETVYHERIQDMEKFIVVMSDRTQERKMMQGLRETLHAARSANEAKSHFLSNMSHDIRTPMNAITGFSILLAKDADQPEKVREYTRKITASSQHLLGLINDVLDMSKIESGKTSLNVAEFSLPDLMEELYSILLPQARAKGQRFEFHVQGCPAELLLGDKLRLNQILINLLSNAIKYTQEGGEIDFTVQGEASGSQYAQLRFVVQDNGMGMTPEFLETIFDPFSREASSAASGIQGTGLGMAITKNLVDLMNGTIEVSSRPGEGSVFTVELRFSLPDAEDAEDADTFWQRYGISRVLAVDDEEEICRNIQEMMRNTGVEVCYATDASTAVSMAVQTQALGEGFHVIVLDWKMPDQSGVETARQLREQLHKNIPILILTDCGWSEIEEEARAAGIDAFMPKPFFVSTFRQTLKALYQNGTEDTPPTEEAHVLEGLLFLVAEDNELNAEILCEMLDMEGARCELAVNGEEVVEIFQRSDPDYYDMILMDVQMPVMDGYAATRAIRACKHPRAKSIPIVAMTANAFAEDVRNALDAGMDGHLSKPIDMEAVKSLLGQLRE